MPSFVAKIKYEDPVLGRALYRVIDLEDGSEIEPVGHYLREKIKRDNSPKNSIDAWADDLVCFYNYYIAASVLQENIHFSKPATAISEIIFSYPDYLAFGKNSSNAIAKEVSRVLDRSKISKETAKRRLSTLRSYIRSSVIDHENKKAINGFMGVEVDVTTETLFSNIVSKRELTKAEKENLIKNSFLAGLVKHGPRYISNSMFALPGMSSSTSSNKGAWVAKAFPPKFLLDLIENASSYRDRCLWSLLAGTGIRTSEAMQLTTDDVNPINENVKILSYEDRVLAFGHLDNNEIEQFSFKGRDTEDVYFLEPFKTIFFDSLALYLEKERPFSNHNMLFVVLSNNQRGRPWYLSDANSHNKTFKAVQKKIGVPGIYTIHSLRHFYGTWVHNFSKHDNGFGFDLSTVKRMMGHANVTTTERYAIKDRMIVLKQLESANRHMQRNRFDLQGMQEQSITHLNSQVEQFLLSD